MAEVIVEILDNALNHSKGDCILNLNVLKNDLHKYKYVDVALVSIDEVFIGKEIIEYINKEDKSESGKIDYHSFKPVLFEFPTYEYFVTGEKVGDCAKMN